MAVGSTDLDQMLRTLDVVARPGEYVYASAPPGHPAVAAAAAVVEEDEGLTVVIRRDEADADGLPYEFVGAWLTLTVHSSLEAVGLTAAFSRRLAEEGISCNVLAGLRHDHLLVPVAQRDRAIAALRSLREK